jgi:hypothetical protein
MPRLFDSVDANNNDRVCWIPHPPQSTSYAPPHNYAANIVDDVSAAG